MSFFNPRPHFVLYAFSIFIAAAAFWGATAEASTITLGSAEAYAVLYQGTGIQFERPGTAGELDVREAKTGESGSLSSESHIGGHVPYSVDSDVLVGFLGAVVLLIGLRMRYRTKT